MGRPTKKKKGVADKNAQGANNSKKRVTARCVSVTPKVIIKNRRMMRKAAKATTLPRLHAI